ncbi:uncharacterized protein METZ01_LOCUS128597 [marine metagenome]|uniref:Lipoprotein SmpA/OmlA domain-containing protein n=1 Tax=marine metagenome TaxID=408172 RepID=A0A381YGU2_9ZZZZ
MIVSFLLTLTACFGPFKKKPEPEPEPVTNGIPAINDQWFQVKALIKRDKVKKLVGEPLFIDVNRVGEDWYYHYEESTVFAIISFPRTGHLTDRVQYLRYPEWR